MILSEYDRRWAEIRLYQFCLDIYAIRHQSIDIFDYVDLICSFADIDKKQIKPLIRVMLQDTYYQANKREIIMIGTVKGLSANNISNYIGMSRQGVTQFIERNKGTFTPFPRCSVADDEMIIKFINTVDKLKEIGRLGYGTTIN